MSYRLIRHRKDNTHDAIREALEIAGYIVESDGKVDLLVRHKTWYRNCWVKLECKTRKTKVFKPDPRQKTQTDYVYDNGIPYTFEPEDALKYLRMHGQVLIDPFADRLRAE